MEGIICMSVDFGRWSEFFFLYKLLLQCGEEGMCITQVKQVPKWYVGVCMPWRMTYQIRLIIVRIYNMR